MSWTAGNGNWAIGGVAIKPAAQTIVPRTSLHGRQHRLVVGGIAHHQDPLVVLGRGAQQGHPADVDLLHGLGQRDAGLGHRLAEGVEVADHQVDEGQVVRGQLGQVFGRAAGQNAAVHGRVQRLDPAAQNLGKTGHIADIPGRQPGLAQGRGRAAAGDQLDPNGVQPGCQINQAALVPDADQGSILGHTSTSLPSTVR